ncbi:cobyric acid synthase [Candidatus Hodgkinia cicadicola]
MLNKTNKPKIIMIQATSSSAGKSLMCACLCKIAKEMGINVAPFKAQNMSNNTVITLEGRQLSSAQWLQAIGCGLIASVNMGPIIIKCRANYKSQVLICGELEYDDYVYPGSVELRERMRECVVSSFKRLCERYELIIVEGAGANSEVNLRNYDISNMWLANSVDCDVVLLSDIERGGALAALIGTHHLLSPHERRLIKGYIINKFSGNVSLLRPGLELVTKVTDWSCYGIVPWLSEAWKLPSEDSIWEKRRVISSACVGIIIDLPFFCNYNDYAALILEPEVSILYTQAPPACVWDNVKFIVVPDTMSIGVGLGLIFSLGWDSYIRDAHKKGVLIIGVGLGLSILSKRFVANGVTLFGLGLLDLDVLFLDVLPLRSMCECKLLALSVAVGTNKIARFIRGVSGQRVQSLLNNADTEFGVYNSNVWAVCVQGLFLDDTFRYAFLRMLNINTCFNVYLDKVDNVLSKLAYSVAPALGANLLSLIRDI